MTDAVPHDNWKVVTLVGAMRSDGPTAALAFPGPTDAAAFQAFVERSLCPTLRAGDVVVMDRLGAHRGPAVRGAIESARARLMPYRQGIRSPELVDVFAGVMVLSEVA